MNIRIKIIIFNVVLASFLLSNSLFSGESKSLFEQANELYKQGNIEGAFALYQQVPEKNASLYYNLGNCAFKLGKNGYALLYWRRAEQDWGFVDRFDLIDNIWLLKEKIAQEQGLLSKKANPILRSISKIKTIVFSYMQAIPLMLLQLLFLIFWLLLFLYIRFLYRRQKKFLIVLLFVVVALTGVLMIVRYGFNVQKRGVVIQEKSALYSGPSSFFNPLGYLNEADEVIVKKESGDFIKVKSRRMMGWIQKDVIEMIKDL